MKIRKVQHNLLCASARLYLAKCGLEQADARDSRVNQQQFYIDLSTLGGGGMYVLHVLDASQNVKSMQQIVLQ